MFRGTGRMFAPAAAPPTTLGEATASAVLSCGEESDTPWYSLGSVCATLADSTPHAWRLPAVASAPDEGRWRVSGAPPTWFGAAEKLAKNRSLNPSEAFALTNLLAAGDATSLERLLRNVEVHSDPKSRPEPVFAVSPDPLARGRAAFKNTSRRRRGGPRARPRGFLGVSVQKSARKVESFVIRSRGRRLSRRPRTPPRRGAAATRRRPRGL